jgi:hypothetical protein
MFTFQYNFQQQKHFSSIPRSVYTGHWVNLGCDPGSILDRFLIDSRSIRDRCRVDSGSIQGRSWVVPGSSLGRSKLELLLRSRVDSGSIQGQFGVDPGSIGDRSRVDSGSIPRIDPGSPLGTFGVEPGSTQHRSEVTFSSIQGRSRLGRSRAGSGSIQGRPWVSTRYSTRAYLTPILLIQHNSPRYTNYRSILYCRRIQRIRHQAPAS